MVVYRQDLLRTYTLFQDHAIVHRVRKKIYEAEKYKTEVKEFSHHNQM